MTSITRQELELCAELLGYEPTDDGYVRSPLGDGHYYNFPFEPENDSTMLMALARAAKLSIDYRLQVVMWFTPESIFEAGSLSWPADGTESECIIKAAAAVQVEREKANG